MSGSPQQYDAVIIGSGQGGNPLATAFARAGRKTALIERQHVGGTCINYGCTPTKTMIASGRVAHLARRAEDYGINVQDLTIDMKKIRQRKRNIVKSFRSGSEKGIADTDNLELLYGHARFVGRTEIAVRREAGGDVTLTAKHIFLNTGTRPAIPPVDGLEELDYLDSTSIMELDAVPEHLIVLGGGYVGLEFGQLFRRLGSEVTIVQMGSQLLPREDKDVADEVAGILREDGITVHLDTKATAVTRRDGRISLAAESAGEELTIAGSHLLVATGRRPNSDDLGLDTVGIETDEHGFVRVNERLETNIDGIYALGDVKGGPQFTHIAYDDYRILESNLLKNGKASTAHRLVPYTVFIDPQLGRVGLTEKRASQDGLAFTVAKLPMNRVARGLETDETRGFLKVLVDTKTGQLLGCAMLAPEGGEIMNMIQIAMMGELPYTALRDAPLAHPTFGESLNNLFAKLDVSI